MGEHLVGGIITVATAIVGLATIAVLVGKQAQTGAVITSAGNAFASDLKAAVSPVTGAGTMND